MIKCFEVSGTRYEMGFRIGEVFKDYLQDAIQKYDQRLEESEESRDYVKQMAETIEKHSHNCFEEIRGRAAGAGVSIDSLVLMFSPEFFNKEDGCTTAYMRTSDGKLLFSHNEDNIGFNENNVALIKYNYGTSWTVSYTKAEGLAGCAFSYNSRGMIFSTNFISADQRNLDAPSRYILIRDIIDTCSLGDAICRVMETPSASPFSLNIADTTASRAVNAEKDVDRLFVKEMEDRYGRSNHFVLRTGEIIAKPNSLFRNEKINESVAAINPNKATAQMLVDALSYSEDDYERCIYKDYKKYSGKGISTTVANFSYDGTTGRVKILDYITEDTAEWEYDGFVSNT